MNIPLESLYNSLPTHVLKDLVIAALKPSEDSNRGDFGATFLHSVLQDKPNVSENIKSKFSGKVVMLSNSSKTSKSHIPKPKTGCRKPRVFRLLRKDTSLKFADFVEMNQLWCAYIIDLLQPKSSNCVSFPAKLVKADFMVVFWVSPNPKTQLWLDKLGLSSTKAKIYFW
eukprot:Sdes_comp15602_c0_seq2m4598